MSAETPRRSHVAGAGRCTLSRLFCHHVRLTLVALVAVASLEASAAECQTGPRRVLFDLCIMGQPVEKTLFVGSLSSPVERSWEPTLDVSLGIGLKFPITKRMAWTCSLEGAGGGGDGFSYGRAGLRLGYRFDVFDGYPLDLFIRGGGALVGVADSVYHFPADCHYEIDGTSLVPFGSLGFRCSFRRWMYWDYPIGHVFVGVEYVLWEAEHAATTDCSSSTAGIVTMGSPEKGGISLSLGIQFAK